MEGGGPGAGRCVRAGREVGAVTPEGGRPCGPPVAEKMSCRHPVEGLSGLSPQRAKREIY